MCPGVSCGVLWCPVVIRCTELKSSFYDFPVRLRHKNIKEYEEKVIIVTNTSACMRNLQLKVPNLSLFEEKICLGRFSSVLVNGL